MIKIERLVFNPFQENTYIVWDDSGEALIIDPGCYDQNEEQALVKFLDDSKLKPVAQIFTHTHIDHILGASFVYGHYGLRPVMHRDALQFYTEADKQGLMFGFEIDEIVEPEKFIDEGDKVAFGSSHLHVLHTPGHVDGHLCFVCRENKFAVAGDVLFLESIGRTDLPTGNFDLLARHIRNKIYTLGDDFTIYPGHGPHTTVGHEIFNNPFVNGK